MATVSVWVDADVELMDIPTEDLVDELAMRSEPAAREVRLVKAPKAALAFLREVGCPPEALEPAEAWLRTPQADEKRLAAWVKWVRGPGPETGDEPC